MAEPKKVYCYNCVHIGGVIWYTCDILRDTFFQPNQPSDPAIKNCENNCPDHFERPGVVQRVRAGDN